MRVRYSKCLQATSATHRQRNSNSSHEVAWITPGQTSLIPPRWKDERGNLIPKRLSDEFSYAEFSDRTWQPQLQYVDTTPVKSPRAEWEARSIFFNEVEHKIISLAFDEPEAIGLHLKDCVIRGIQEVMQPSVLLNVIHWVKEARYWRCIGIYHPFYRQHRLRAHVWKWGYLPGTDYVKGSLEGVPLISRPMKDALLDLEKAYKRAQAGLEPRYRWAKWSPVGNNDGSMNDWLPRLPSMKWDPDPDGITATEADLDFILHASQNKEQPMSLHDIIKRRYWPFIYRVSDEYDNVFLAPSMGQLTERDFPFSPVSSDLLENAYFVAYCHSENLLPQNVKYDEKMRTKIHELMTENALKVEAVRLFRNCSSDVTWTRRYIEEKCHLTSFMHTTDQELTLILSKLYESMHSILEIKEPWAQQVALAETTHDYQRAVGSIAYNVAMKLQYAAEERIREKWSGRFTNVGQEEKMLDNLLIKMSQRTSASEPGNIGATFDREKEPIGRNTQRRIITPDISTKATGKFWEKKDSTKAKLDDNVFSTQF